MARFGSLLLAIIVLVATAVNALHVWDPKARALLTYQHRVAAFEDIGETPGWGDTVLGSLVLPDASNRNLCVAPVQNAFRGLVVLVLRGECTFVDKVKNAERGNAAAIIIGNNVCCDIVEMHARDDQNPALSSLPLAVSVDMNTYYGLSDMIKKLNSTVGEDLFPSYPNAIPNAPFTILVEPESGATTYDDSCDERVHNMAVSFMKINLAFAAIFLGCLCCMRRRRNRLLAQQFPNGMPPAAPAAAGAVYPGNAMPRTVYAPTPAAPSSSGVVPFRIVPIQAAPSSYVPESPVSPVVVGVPSDEPAAVSRNGYARVPETEMSNGPRAC